MTPQPSALSACRALTKQFILSLYHDKIPSSYCDDSLNRIVSIATATACIFDWKVDLVIIHVFRAGRVKILSTLPNLQQLRPAL